MPRIRESYPKWPCLDMGVSKNNGTPKSSILIGFSIINHPFWGKTLYFWFNTHMDGMPRRLVRDLEVIWLSFFFQTFVAAMGVAAQLGDHFQGTMFFMTLVRNFFTKPTKCAKLKERWKIMQKMRPLFIYLFIYLFINLFIYLFVHLCFYLFVFVWFFVMSEKCG